MPPTDVTGSKTAMPNDTGNLLQVTQLMRRKGAGVQQVRSNQATPTETARTAAGNR